MYGPISDFFFKSIFAKNSKGPLFTPMMKTGETRTLEYLAKVIILMIMGYSL